MSDNQQLASLQLQHFYPDDLKIQEVIETDNEIIISPW